MLRHLIFPERPLIVNGIELAIFPRLVAEIGVGREEKLILDVSEQRLAKNYQSFY